MKLYRKRCTKCGGTFKVSSRIKRCKAIKVPGGFWCYGALVSLEARKATRKAPASRPQEIAAKKAEQASKAIAGHLTSIKRLMTAIDKWQKRAAYYSKRAAMSDAEMAAERDRAELAREKAKQRAKGVRGVRAVVLDDDEQS